ncbi:AtzE family amidohydrolase [Chenggangzhangella methanolivorans]|uniref:AtzE family amidohydrolase n=1 Tax=Chenggangzhangella methanolivorans TaxID=1437009 RepID=A0A9E6REG4_9HYPH|nr:AtzE family amidohydrolase [Chenggangzhangella methanolivorans]QZO02565.1 AtzE family amidohydrolase [Chenggangzhangella methanolivorans]
MSLAAARPEPGPAEQAAAAALARIDALDGRVGAFTDVTAERALSAARALDAGANSGALAGVAFAVKNLFDVEGLPTRAGSRINRDRARATRDAALLTRMEAAGAILTGALNMGEYAYDFTGENIHDGPSRNPHDLTRMSGGSSGGSGAAVAAGLVDVALASDTNGSIRVPSALCGCFGLKPTYGRLTRAGTFPFVQSLDHLGPIARSTDLLARAYDAMQGPDAEDPATTTRAPEPAAPSLDAGFADLRIATLGGHFARGGEAECFEAVARAAACLGAEAVVEFPEAARARAAAYLITATEGAALHLERLRARPDEFDPAVRDRLIAGATIPSAYVAKAQRFRRWFAQEAARVFETVDILLAPSTPCRAPALGQKTFTLDGVTLPVRPNLGVYTQPISFIGLPVACAPIFLDEGLPLGVQIIAAPWREADALRVARALEAAGVAEFRKAKL